MITTENMALFELFLSTCIVTGVVVHLTVCTEHQFSSEMQVANKKSTFLKLKSSSSYVQCLEGCVKRTRRTSDH